MKGYIIAGTVVSLLGTLGGAGWIISNISYQRGYSDRGEEQAKANLETYQSIIRSINDETLDTTDNDAVLCFLHQLAGTEPDGDECSDLRRD